MIYEKLQKVQTSLKAPKNQSVKNKGGFVMYNYRSCEDILEAVKPFLEKYKLALCLDDSIELIGNRYYIKSTATIIDCEDSSIHKVNAFAQEPTSKGTLDASQITGASSSYARKYALNGLFCIDDTKDNDFHSNECEENNLKSKETPKKEENKKEEIPKVNDKQVSEIMHGCSKHKIDVGVILEMYKIDNLSKLNIKQYQVLMKRFKEKEKENEQSNINGQAN